MFVVIGWILSFNYQLTYFPSAVSPHHQIKLNFMLNACFYSEYKKFSHFIL